VNYATYQDIWLLDPLDKIILSLRHSEEGLNSYTISLNYDLTYSKVLSLSPQGGMADIFLSELTISIADKNE
jgi:hypothetical protein